MSGATGVNPEALRFFAKSPNIGEFINFSQRYTPLSLNLHYKFPASNLGHILRGLTVFREQIVPKGGARGFAKCRSEQGRGYIPNCLACTSAIWP